MIIKTRSLTESLEKKYGLDESYWWEDWENLPKERTDEISNWAKNYVDEICKYDLRNHYIIGPKFEDSNEKFTVIINNKIFNFDWADVWVNKAFYDENCEENLPDNYEDIYDPIDDDPIGYRIISTIESSADYSDGKLNEAYEYEVDDESLTDIDWDLRTMIIKTRQLTESLEKKYGLTKSLKEEDTKENRKYFKDNKWFSYSHKDPVIAKFMEDCKLSMGSMDGYPSSSRFSLKPPFKSGDSVAYFVDIEFHNFDTGEGRIFLWDRTGHAVVDSFNVFSYDEIFKWLKTHPVDNNIMDSVNKYNSKNEESLNESFVEEWWGQTDEDPFEFAYEYDLDCKPIKNHMDSTLYRFTGSLEDIKRAQNDGYFMSVQEGQDEGHSEDLNESKELLEDEDKWVKLNKIVKYRDVADNFECNSHGNVRNAKTGRQLKAVTNQGGYSDLKYTVKTKEGKNKSVAKEQLIKEIEDSFIFSKLGEKNESLNESIAGDIIWEKVRDVIREKIDTEIIDNLAMVISSEVPEYNPDWCAESSNQSQWAADKLAEELATELMFELE